MNKVDPIIFKNKFSIEFLPTETLLGLKTINCEVLCEDNEYRWVNGIEVGLVFFTFTYANMKS